MVVKKMSDNARRLIVTADDFGRAEAINEAVEKGHREGVLTAASLMVTGAAAKDAVERARRLPSLDVGLHMALVDAIPALTPERIPDLVGPDGRLTSNLVSLGVRIFLSTKTREQVEAEMRAQFELFRATGLPLTHVDSHHHYHLHPTVFALLVPMSKEFGAKRIRVPYEPPLASWRARRDRLFARLFTAGLHAYRTGRMRALAVERGLVVNDAMFGLFDSGAMSADRLIAYLDNLPPGLNEIYCHPGVSRWTGADPMPADYSPVDEYHALIAAEVMECVRRHGIRLTSFGRETA